MGEDINTFSLLLVDDEPLIINLLRDTFAEENYQIYTSSNGREAINVLERAKIDAALIDLIMPEMDGLTLLQEIRRRFPSVMLIMLTGHGGVREAVEAIQLGAFDFLEKPFEVNALRIRIGQLHRIWQLNEENIHFEAHIDFAENATLEEANRTFEEIRELLRKEFGINHVTLQPEYNACHRQDLISQTH